MLDNETTPRLEDADGHTAVVRPDVSTPPLIRRRPSPSDAPAATSAEETSVSVAPKKVVRVRPASVPAVSGATLYQQSAPRRALVRKLVTLAVLIGGLGVSAAVADHIIVEKAGHPVPCTVQCPPPTWYSK
jgi:hypothetical protein